MAYKGETFHWIGNLLNLKLSDQQSLTRILVVKTKPHEFYGSPIYLDALFLSYKCSRWD